LSDKHRSLELLGRHLKLFTDKILLGEGKRGRGPRRQAETAGETGGSKARFILGTVAVAVRHSGVGLTLGS